MGSHRRDFDQRRNQHGHDYRAVSQDPKVKVPKFPIHANSDKWSRTRPILLSQVSVESRVLFADNGRCMDSRTDQSPSQAAASPPTTANGMVDVEAILREVEALTQAAMQTDFGSAVPASSTTESTSTESTSTESTSTESAPILNTTSNGAAAAPANSELHGGAHATVSTPEAMSSPVETGTLDLDKLERELNALLRGSTTTGDAGDSLSSGSMQSPVLGSSVDTDSLNTGNQNPAALNSVTPTETRPSVASAALETEPVDPMQREITAILDDTNDAVLRAADNSIDRALDTVFDARALAGQEEDVNRALIEAFGTSRRPVGFGSFDATQGTVTNPVPRFEGISRALPSEIASGSITASNGISTVASVEIPTPPRRFEEIAAQSIGRESRPEYAGETPFEPAFPAVPIADTNSAVPSEQSSAASLTVQDATAKTAAKQAVSNTLEQRVSADTNARSAEQLPSENTVGTSNTTPSETSPSDASPRKPFFATLATRITAGIRVVATLPLQVCALPMRCIPASFRGYITVTALSMLVWAPVAWWMAQRSTHVQGVGRIEFPVATDDKHDDAQNAASDKADDSAESGADHAAASAATEQSGAHSADHH